MVSSTCFDPPDCDQERLLRSSKQAVFVGRSSKLRVWGRDQNATLQPAQFPLQQSVWQGIALWETHLPEGLPFRAVWGVPSGRATLLPLWQGVTRLMHAQEQE